MTKKTFILSFDLGLRGDYQGLYYFLDKYEGKECGNSVAMITYEVGDNIPFSEEVELIKTELMDSVNINEKLDRIYVLGRDSETNKMKGRFIVGRRKESPWSGYYSLEEVGMDDVM